MINQNEIYVNKENTVLLNTDNKFVYEVQVFCSYKGYYGIINRKYYSSPKEIPYVVADFYKDAHTKISSSLLAAPLPWLLENNYVKYVKPDKKVINKTKNKNVKSKTTIGKQRSWRADGQTDST